MKKIIILLVTALVFGCTDKFDELNTDKKSPASVTGESLFNNATERFHHILNNANANSNVFKLYAQYWAATTYPDESQYNQVNRRIPDSWFTRLYRDALRNLDESKKIIGTQETNAQTAPIQQNKLAIIAITEVHIYTILVDLFGDIPYTEALDFNTPNPKYDDAKTVYYDNIAKLDKAITDLNPGVASFDGRDDLINQGKTEMWLKVANSLKLRLAMRLVDVDQAKAKTMAESALKSGVFTGVSENYSAKYTMNAPYTFPAYEDLQLSGRADYVGANTIVDKMNALNDPRRKFFFQQNLGDGVYKGGIYGSGNAFPNFSAPGKYFYVANTSGVSMRYSEVLFLRAEGAQLGFDMGGTVTDLYNMAVTASVQEWGGTEAEAKTYLAQPSVAYATAEGDWRQKIGIQKWLALYGNGLEGWTTWRELDFTGFKAPKGQTLADIPTRLIYPIAEATLNGENLGKAASAIGGDVATTKVFWDVK